MTLPITEVHLQDCSGNTHLYQIEPFTFDESFDLGMELADLVGGPVGEAIKAMMTGGDFDLDSAVDDSTLGKALAEITTIPRRIMQAGGSELVARVLANTMRTGKDGNGKPVKQYMREPAARTAAYAGGNQAEAVAAMKAVLEVNYGPFLARLYETVSPYLAGLGTSLTSLGPKRMQAKGEMGDTQDLPGSERRTKGGTA